MAYVVFNNVPKLTPAQSAIVSAYTGVLCCPIEVLQAYAANLLVRQYVPVEQFRDVNFIRALQIKSTPDFLSICPHFVEPFKPHVGE